MTSRIRTAIDTILVISAASIVGLLNGQPPSPNSVATERQARSRYEAEVARLFEDTRRAANLPPLSRVANRESLEELLCTTAIQGKSVWHENRPAKLMYKTTSPNQPTTELKAIAQYQPARDDHGIERDTRYSVAVWPAVEKIEGQRAFWVGIEIIPSAFIEFVDKNLTDNRPYRNDWKKLVSPECRSVR